MPAGDPCHCVSSHGTSTAMVPGASTRNAADPAQARAFEVTQER